MKRSLSIILSVILLLSSVISFSGGAGSLKFTETSGYRFSSDRAYVMGVDGIPDADEFISNFADADNVTVKTPAGAIREGKVASDDIVTNGVDSVRVLVYGDADRNAKINARDVICTMKYVCDPTVDVCV